MITNKKNIDGIPVIECIPERSVPYQGVFFLIHGHTCSKELWYFGSLPERLCRLGFWVVSIDADKHGQRKEEPYLTNDSIAMTEAMMNVVLNTTKDVYYLYKEHYQKNGGKLGILGISMGGHITFQTVKYFDQIDFLIPLIGAPNLRRHYYDSKKDLLGIIRLQQLEPQFINAEIPHHFFSRVNHGLIMEGLEDHVVLADNAHEYYQQLIHQGFQQITYQSYNIGHQVTSEMEIAVETYLSNLIFNH